MQHYCTFKKTSHWKEPMSNESQVNYVCMVTCVCSRDEMCEFREGKISNSSKDAPTRIINTQ